ncbi:hypothetical protein TNCV_2657151 [Trichonephila clavipes]|nr:hypothetical protein TNCV_2657151 [Trichonephila clavipes]
MENKSKEDNHRPLEELQDHCMVLKRVPQLYRENLSESWLQSNKTEEKVTSNSENDQKMLIMVQKILIVDF